jgi:sulfur carrier protein
MPGITLNGENRSVEGGTTIRSLLRQLSVPEARVAVERNLSIVRKSEYDGTVLEEGDRLEIVTFVGGG